MTTTARLALVTGVTGYLGPRLAPRLLDAGWRVRVLTRDARRIADTTWIDRVEVVEGDLGDAAVLQQAVDGTDVAYYLVHSMSGSHSYAEQDRRLATAFAQACARAGTSRIVYLGGLYPAGEILSAHLASRREVGQILLDGAVPATVLQAGMVIGAGSASYDMLGAVAGRLPVLVAPTWLDNHVQPISVDDALHYLVGSADMPGDVNGAFDIGGPDVVRYRDLVRTFAEVTGRRPPRIVLVPVLLPRTASLWAGILTPGPTALNAALVHSLTLDMVCTDGSRIAALVPDPPGGLDGVTAALTAAVPR